MESEIVGITEMITEYFNWLFKSLAKHFLPFISWNLNFPWPLQGDTVSKDLVSIQ
jgi:hypothetical protein